MIPPMQGVDRLAASINENLRQLLGVRLDRNEEAAWLTPDVTPTPLVIGATGLRMIFTVGQEADFVATGIVVQADDQATPPVLLQNAFRWQIRDGSTNRELQRADMPQGFLATSVPGFQAAGSAPYFLAKPRIFSRNSNVIVTLDNVQGAAINVDWAFFGYRIYDVDALDLTKAR
jgi:hypothetical protein